MSAQERARNLSASSTKSPDGARTHLWNTRASPVNSPVFQRKSAAGQGPDLPMLRATPARDSSEPLSAEDSAVSDSWSEAPFRSRLSAAERGTQNAADQTMRMEVEVNRGEDGLLGLDIADTIPWTIVGVVKGSRAEREGRLATGD